MTLTPDLLLHAYASGIFPMAESREDGDLFWVDPEVRAIIPLDAFHLPRRLARTVRQGKFEVRIDTAFAQVMTACAGGGGGRPESWINDTILRLYGALFERGVCHSVECWSGDKLVGGLYGLHLGAAFFGESMFSRATDASKVALVYLLARLIRGGFMLLDTQFLTPHLARFGCIEISRDVYHRRLRAAIANQGADYFALAVDEGPETILQSLIHKS